MGYEILYKYHERLEEGGYNKDETKELKRKIGDAFEEVSLDKCAAAVMRQLARRDIWVVDWEVYEYKKTKVNCRETKGGIVIKNKKFSLDGDSHDIKEEDIIEGTSLVPMPGTSMPGTSVALQPGQQPHERILSPVQQAQVANGQPVMRRPIKIVQLDTDLPTMHKVKTQGLQFSANKRYPVFEEKPDPRDKRVDRFGQPVLDRKTLYVMWDDHKREITTSSDYFVPGQIQLEGGAEFNRATEQAATGGGPKLMYEGEVEGGVPDVRDVRTLGGR